MRAWRIFTNEASLVADGKAIERLRAELRNALQSAAGRVLTLLGELTSNEMYNVE